MVQEIDDTNPTLVGTLDFSLLQNLVFGEVPTSVT